MKKYDKNSNWNFNYRELHYYIKKYKLKPEDSKCELCNNIIDYLGNTKLILSNKTGKLIKDLDNFQWVHESCHKLYDNKYNIIHECKIESMESTIDKINEV